MSQPLALGADERILVLAPHPDDEVLGCAGILQHAVERGLPLRLVFLTNGDFNERSFAVYRGHLVLEPRAVIEMGRIRRQEALAAARILRIPASQVVFLGYPDFGTLQIFEAHWGERPPFRSYLTERTEVPYEHALHFGAPHKGESILSDLTREIRDFSPTRVFVSHPADHHPDHRALFLFAQVVLWDLGIRPEVFPYLVHRAGWPLPEGDHPEVALDPPADLAEVTEWHRFGLSPEAIARKRAALEAHKTQFEYSARALSSFLRRNELFGAIAPVEVGRHQPTLLGGDTAWLQTRAPEQLLATERERFVAVAMNTVRWEPQAVEIELEVDRWHPDATISLFLFPYGPGRSFAEMPKLHLKLKAVSHEILDQDRRLPGDSVQLRRAGKKVTVSVPTALLHGADRLLCSARTQIGVVPLDWTPWRVLQMDR